MQKVSVILTTYNGAKCIARTIQSIQQQEGIAEVFDLELIVIDDCSTDNTLEILHQLNVAPLSTQKNSGGPNKGRNIGLKKATGDYICITDHDDVWESHKLIQILPYLEKYPIATSGYSVIDTSTNKKFVRVQESVLSYKHYPQNTTFIELLKKSFKGQNTYLGAIVFNQKLKHILFEEVYGMVDFDWIVRLFHQQESVEICDALYRRYVDGHNLSLNEAYRRKDFYHSLMFIESYQNQYPKEVTIANLKIHGSRARYYYLIGNMKLARFYFLRSNWGWKTLLYYMTSFVGHSWVKKNFNVFG